MLATKAEAIACTFVRSYYRDLVEADTAILTRYYSDQSTLSAAIDGDCNRGKSIVGRNEIGEFFDELRRTLSDGKKFAVQVRNVDYVAGRDCVSVTCSGTIVSFLKSRVFTQTFVLNPTQYRDNVYYISGETLRYISCTEEEVPANHTVISQADYDRVKAQAAAHISDAEDAPAVPKKAPKEREPRERKEREPREPKAAKPAEKEVVKTEAKAEVKTQNERPARKEREPRERKEREPREPKPAEKEVVKTEAKAEVKTQNERPARKEREPRERKEREPREPKEREPRERKEREPREPKEREPRERKEREPREPKAAKPAEGQEEKAPRQPRQTTNKVRIVAVPRAIKFDTIKEDAAQLGAVVAFKPDGKDVVVEFADPKAAGAMARLTKKYKATDKFPGLTIKFEF